MTMAVVNNEGIVATRRFHRMFSKPLYPIERISNVSDAQRVDTCETKKSSKPNNRRCH
jgi:hypothetical protein